MAKTQTPFPTLIVSLCVIVLLLNNNVKPAESVSFSFPNFGKDFDNIDFLGDARPLEGVIQLTKRDNYKVPFGIPTIHKHSVGRAVFIPPVQLWDKTTDKLADFETEFSFVVDSAGSQIPADGFSFFIIPLDADPSIPKNSTGAYLGLFNPKTAFNALKNQIVAVEFDTFRNEWDPIPQPFDAHIGIDIDSLESVDTVEWPINFVPQGSVGKAIISYDSDAKKLSVLVGYDTQSPTIVALSQTIDLRGVLPEWVRIGFSGATGDSVETHDILSWSFTSRI